MLNDMNLSNFVIVQLSLSNDQYNEEWKRIHSRMTNC